MFDAYTIKKVLPRLVVAVILIQLSWFIFTGAIALTNLISFGLEAFIAAPFGGTQDLELQNIFNPGGDNAGQNSGLVLVSLVGLGAVGVIGAGGILALGTFVLMALLVGFFTLVLRRILLIALLIVAPIAIVAWILPGTQRIWKLWWDNFSKLLLMFPLIILMITTGKALAAVTVGSDTGDIAKIVVAYAAFFTPFFLIPLTYKAAGAGLSMASGFMKSKTDPIADSMRKRGRERQAQRRERLGRRVTQKRADWQNQLQDQASMDRRNAFSRFALRQASRGVGGYNIQAADSARRAAVGKELNDQIATGRDDEIRGLTVNKRAATEENGLMRVHNGVRQYQTLGGAWVSEGAVDAGHKRWGNDTYAQQAALSYEMRKAATDGQVQGIGDRYRTLATAGGGWGMSDNQARGALIGAGFENQGTHLEFKHMDLDGNVNYANFAREIYEKKGSYPLSQMSAHTVQRLQEAYNTGDAETRRMVQGVAETFVSRYGGGGGIAGMADDVPIPQPGGAVAPGAAAAPTVQTNTPGAAHVGEAVRQLAVNVGVYQQPDPTTNTTSAGPPPPIPRQN